MHHSQTIEFLEWKKQRVCVAYRNEFVLREDRPLVWLQKICFSILTKLKAVRSVAVHEEQITRHRIDPASFMERLFLQEKNLHQYFDIEPKRLLIGAKDYQRIMSSQELIAQMISFDCEYHNERSIHGLKVTIVPWMSGILVMPRYY